MKHNWFLIGAIIAVLAIPFGLAAFEDSTREKPVDETSLDSLSSQSAHTDWGLEGSENGDESEEDGPVIARWERSDDVDVSFLDEVASVTGPWLDGALAGAVIAVESDKDEAQLFLDAVVRQFNHRHDGALITLTADVSSHRTSVVFSIPATPLVLQKLRRRWGEPTASEVGRQHSWSWFDDGNRAVLSEFGSVLELSFTRTVSASDVLEAFVLSRPRGRFDVESARERFGASVDEDETTVVFEMRPTRAANVERTRIELERSPRGRVTRVAMILDCSLDLTERSDILVQIGNALGAPTVRAGDLETSLVYNEGVTAISRKHRLVIVKE